MVLGSTLVSILHVCGGDPCAWPVPRWINLVFSTYVEVILVIQSATQARTRILHVCGGDPPIAYNDSKHAVYSPRMWR